MSGLADRDWRDRAAREYLDALDSGDAEAFASLWERAADDPQLEDFLRKLGEGLRAEEDSDDFESDAHLVRELASKHLLEFTTPELPSGPITVADVARQLQSEPDAGRRLDASDRLANAAMLSRDEPVPDPIKLSGLDAWGKSLGISASARYWSAFHGTVVSLRMARGQQTRLAAARRADPKPDGEGGKR